MKLIIKKEHYPSFSSIKMVRCFRCNLVARLYKLYYRIRVYEVEELDD